MTLDLSSLQKSVQALERAVQVASHQIQGKVQTDQEEVAALRFVADARSLLKTLEARND